MAFKAISRTQALNDVVTFELNGTRFVCRNHVTIGALMRLMKAESGDGVAALMSFFQQALMDSDYQKFTELLDDPNVYLTFEDLTELSKWLTEVYTGQRPTGEGSSASSTHPSIGDGSTAGASPTATTYSRSPQTAV